MQFSALGRRFRVLVLLNERKQKYRATLGLVDGSDLQIFCSYEFHSDEPGWHCHLTCEDDSQVPAGVMRGPWVLRWPGGGKFHRHTKFSVTEENALNIAIDRYQIKETGVLL